MSNDPVIGPAPGNVQVIIVSEKSFDPTLLKERLRTFINDVASIAQAELGRIVLVFADSRCEVVLCSDDPSEEALAYETRLARARKLLADIGHGERDSGERKRRD